MSRCAVHVSDLHLAGELAAPVEQCLRALVAELQPEIVIASGDLTHRARPGQFEAAHALLGSLDAPLLAVPGNHDIPHSPLRLVRPWARFERVFHTVQPIHRSESLVVVGLCSARPWRHQGGRLSGGALDYAAEALAEPPGDALRVVALHHHLATAPWRTARKFPLRRREAVLDALGKAGAELVLSGHVHQSSIVEPREFVVDRGLAHDLPILVTSPGLSRPRPHRTGEAQGLQVVGWDERSITIETRSWDGSSFATIAERRFSRRL